MPQKVKLDLDRPARPEDSTERARDYPAVIKGMAEDTFLTFDELLEKCALDSADRQENGDYAFAKNTVDARVRDNGDTVTLRVITTRPAHPVQFSVVFNRVADGRLHLKSAFAAHANPHLDSQHVNNPAMLAFALSKVHEEVKLVKDPAWWVQTLADYDAKHGSNYAEGYIKDKLGGADPRQAGTATATTTATAGAGKPQP